MLNDYAMPGVDTSFQEPFAGRLLQLLEFFEHRLMIESGRRTRGEQQALYDAYLAGVGNLAAVPGTSNHEKGLAADLHRTDPGLSWGEVHAQAARVGIWFPIVGEDWHAEPLTDWVDTEETEMFDKQGFADAIGATIAPEGHQFAGLVCVELATGPTTDDLFPLASAISYIHKEEKYPSVAR